MRAWHCWRLPLPFLFLYPLLALAGGRAIVAQHDTHGGPHPAGHCPPPITTIWFPPDGRYLLVLWANQLRPKHPRLLSKPPSALFSRDLPARLVGRGHGFPQWPSASLEHTLLESVQATNPSQYPTGTRLFFINLPLTSMESGPAIRHGLRTGRIWIFARSRLSPGPFLPDRAV